MKHVSLTDQKEMAASKHVGDLISQIYHAQDLSTIQAVKDMMRTMIIGNMLNEGYKSTLKAKGLGGPKQDVLSQD